jgi:hypothetical protein
MSKYKRPFMTKAEIPMAIGLIFIVVMWLALFLHPIIIALWMHNPLWLGLYYLIIPEMICAFLLTRLIIKMLE